MDSQAGATGSSVAQFPGRHLLFPPWAAFLVWAVLLVFVSTHFASYRLGSQARKEFRLRKSEQNKQLTAAETDLENQSSAPQPSPSFPDPNRDHPQRRVKPTPISRNELKSFTRQSIMVLNNLDNQKRRTMASFPNALRHPGAHQTIPRDLFNRPNRDSIVVAQIIPLGQHDGDDAFYQFSQQMVQEGFWEKAARKSKRFSTLGGLIHGAHGSPPPALRYHQPLPMMEMLQDEHHRSQSHDPSISESPPDHDPHTVLPDPHRPLRTIEELPDHIWKQEERAAALGRTPPKVNLQIRTAPGLPSSPRRANEPALISPSADRRTNILFEQSNLVSSPISKDKEQEIIIHHSSITPHLAQNEQLCPPQRTSSQKKTGTMYHFFNPQDALGATIEQSIIPGQAMTKYASESELQRKSSKVNIQHDLSPQLKAERGSFGIPELEISPDQAMAQYASAARASITPTGGRPMLAPISTASSSGGSTSSLLKRSSLLGFIRRASPISHHSSNHPFSDRSCSPLSISDPFINAPSSSTESGSVLHQNNNEVTILEEEGESDLAGNETQPLPSLDRGSSSASGSSSGEGFRRSNQRRVSDEMEKIKMRQRRSTIQLDGEFSYKKPPTRELTRQASARRQASSYQGKPGSNSSVSGSSGANIIGSGSGLRRRSTIQQMVLDHSSGRARAPSDPTKPFIRTPSSTGSFRSPSRIPSRRIISPVRTGLNRTTSTRIGSVTTIATTTACAPGTTTSTALSTATTLEVPSRAPRKTTPRRAPLIGTMSSGGVRDSSFLP